MNGPAPQGTHNTGSSPTTRSFCRTSEATDGWPVRAVRRPHACHAIGAGYPVAALDLLLLVLIEAVIVVTAPAIGVMLAMALIVGPAATARLWTDRIGPTVLLSVTLGTGSCALGLSLSTHWNLAAGGTITLVVAI